MENKPSEGNNNKSLFLNLDKKNLNDRKKKACNFTKKVTYLFPFYSVVFFVIKLFSSRLLITSLTQLHKKVDFNFKKVRL